MGISPAMELILVILVVLCQGWPKECLGHPGSLGLARFDGMVTRRIDGSNSDVMGECGKPNINHAPKCGRSQYIPPIYLNITH